MIKETPPLGSRGVTLIEVIVVISIIAVLATIGIVSLSGMGISTFTKASGNAEELRLFVNYARIAAIGTSSDVLVVFKPASSYYYACVDSNEDSDCTASEQGALRLPQPISGMSVAGQVVNGVLLQYDGKFGTFSSSEPRVPQNTLPGTAPLRTASGVYYLDAGGTSITASTGMHTTLTNPSRFVLRNNGSASGGSLYMYLKKDDETSFHHALSVNSRGKVDLYQWAMVTNGSGAAFRWKLTSTR